MKHITEVTVVTNDEPERTRHGEQLANDLHVIFHIDNVLVDEITDGAF
jgi:hypothetical protein